jgi:DNA (cytosine-5)-methyltransferase 1
MPNYPYKFIQANAVDFSDFEEYDVIHASPPCQNYSIGSQGWKNKGYVYPDLVEPIRNKLIESGKPFVMENVVGAPLLFPVVLCGTMFNLKVLRHRLFESNIWLYPPGPCKHNGSVPNGDYVTVAGHGGDGIARFSVWKEAMDIDWMNKKELTQAIPPAYTRWLGRQLITYLDNQPMQQIEKTKVLV